MEESSEQLRDACAYGIRRIVATPHYYPQRDTVSAFLGRRDAAYDRLLAAKTRMPEVFTGAEVLLWPGIDRMQDLHKLCIGTSKTLLIEMPYTSCWDREVTDTLFRLCASYTVVLAHPERYPKESIRQLLTADPILQINAYSFFKLRSRARVQALLSSGRRILLGSDNHGREPYYRTFVKAAALLARKHADSMDCANSLLEA